LRFVPPADFGLDFPISKSVHAVQRGPLVPLASVAQDRVGPRSTAPRRPISPYDVDELPVPPYLMIGVTRAVRSVEGEAFFRLLQAWGRGPPGKRSEAALDRRHEWPTAIQESG